MLVVTGAGQSVNITYTILEYGLLSKLGSLF